MVQLYYNFMYFTKLVSRSKTIMPNCLFRQILYLIRSLIPSTKLLRLNDLMAKKWNPASVAKCPHNLLNASTTEWTVRQLRRTGCATAHMTTPEIHFLKRCISEYKEWNQSRLLISTQLKIVYYFSYVQVRNMIDNNQHCFVGIGLNLTQQWLVDFSKKRKASHPLNILSQLSWQLIKIYHYSKRMVLHSEAWCCHSEFKLVQKMFTISNC